MSLLGRKRKAPEPSPAPLDPFEQAKRERLARAVQVARLRAMGIEDPAQHGLVKPKDEPDPFVASQLATIHQLIQTSIADPDAKDAQPVRVGPLEFLFNAYNDPRTDPELRIRAATSLLSFVHKRVPSSLVLASDARNPLLAGFDPKALSDDELNQLNALLARARKALPPEQP